MINSIKCTFVSNTTTLLQVQGDELDNTVLQLPPGKQFASVVISEAGPFDRFEKVIGRKDLLTHAQVWTIRKWRFEFMNNRPP